MPSRPSTKRFAGRWTPIFLGGILMAAGPAFADPTESAEAPPAEVAEPHAVASPAGEAGPEAAGWRRLAASGDLQPLLEAAYEAGGLALLLVRSHRCEACGAVNRSLMERPDVQRETGHFERGMVDRETVAGREIVLQYRVLTTPALLALAPDGREVARLYPVPTGARLEEALRAIREGTGTLMALEAEAAQNPFDLGLAYEVGRQHALRGDAIGAKRHFARLFVFRRMVDQSSRAVVRGAADVGRLGNSGDFGPVRSSVEADLAGVLEGVDTLIASAYFALGEYVYVRGHEDWSNGLRILEELRRRFPDSPETRAAGLSIALAHHHLGSNRRARVELVRFLEDHARQPDRLAFALRACADGGILVDWAKDQARELTTAHRDHAGLWSVLAALEELTGDAPAALLAARRAATLDDTGTWYAAEAGRLEAAIAEAEADEAAEPVEAAGDDEDVSPKEATSPERSSSDG